MNKIMYRTIFLLFSFVLLQHANAQTVKFAFVTDTHIGNHSGADDLRRTVKDINENPALQFVVVTGDITEFGSDEELKTARQILDSLNKPWYAIAGNHDSNWSESGSNSFRRVFGAETFSFVSGGYLFAATSSGPNMRMGPGQVPRENIVWLDSVLNNMKDPEMPVIYLNHYPQDSAQNNWYEAIDRLKKKNVQLILCGHGHTNQLYDFEGIPGVMGRSNLRAKDSIGGYNIVTLEGGNAIFEVRRPVVQSQSQWLKVAMTNHHFGRDTQRYFRPSYAVNDKYPEAKVLWQYQDKSDVGAGTASGKGLVIATNTSGHIYALDKNTGKQKWLYKTSGKIYSTPEVAGNYVVTGSSDNHIYCLSLLTGKLIWKVAALKPVLGAPVIKDKTVYIGSSDGHFRALKLESGELKWDFDDVKGFVVTKPLIYKDKIYFGCWANDFYALDLASGKLAWKWNNGTSNRMFSPAACYPVASNGRVFIVAPDRYMTSFDAETGNVIWRKQIKDKRVRESMGLSSDGSLVYVKTMDGQLFGVSTRADSMQIDWKSELQLPYELTPSAIVESKGVVYVPSHSGLASAVERKSGKVLWQYKSSNSLLNPVMPLDKNKVVLSTMDGKITCIEYLKK
ncbi:PQQ-binding-like beta-propeller repeat protein [Arcticibacter tournemirensis]|uniref:PQQ-binding-like beta-propeller repeat protein n=2 Tax=Arcticibacter tournemirensis TaxID=699437 RepID=A0A5M9HBQ6_9SPHI|nr:PQQ-binding-like beta-propeller repeat protein [Arcticibacter tournemirensis]